MQNGILCIVAMLSLYSISLITYFLFTEYSNSDEKVIQIKNSLEEALQAIREDEKLNARLPDPPASSCVLHPAEYTDEEVKTIFRFRNFSNCTTPTQDFIEITPTSIIAKCETDEPRFIIDNGDPQKFGGEKKADVMWSRRNQLKENSEWAFVKCGRKSVYAFAFIRFNKTAADRAERIQQSLGPGSKPNNVLLLVFDSLSKFIAKRYMPKLDIFLRNGIERKDFHKDYAVYELTRMGTQETYTIPNMAQLLYGEEIDVMIKTLDIRKPEFDAYSQKHIDRQVKKSIWSYFSSVGYTTLFLMDTVWDFTSRFLGRHIIADHVFANYWRAAWAVYNYEDFSNRQRCVGRQNSHNLTFTYVFDYFQTYKSLNKFAYVHLDAAHELTGNIQTVDHDLIFFLSGLFDLFSQRNESFAVFLLSDHGIRFSRLDYDVRAHIETTSPMSFFILSKEIEQKLQARENLWHNSHQLIGRLDIHYAMKYLAHFPYGYENFTYFEEMKKDYTVPSVVNLFKEKIGVERNCKDLNVPENRCVCSWFVEANDEKFTKRLINLIHRYNQAKAGVVGCGKMREYEVLESIKMVIEPKSRGLITIYRLSLLVNKKRVLNAEFVFCYAEKIKNGYRALEGELFPIRELTSRDGKVVIQLRKIEFVGCEEQNCLC